MALGPRPPRAPHKAQRYPPPPPTPPHLKRDRRQHSLSRQVLVGAARVHQLRQLLPHRRRHLLEGGDGLQPPPGPPPRSLPSVSLRFSRRALLPHRPLSQHRAVPRDAAGECVGWGRAGGREPGAVRANGRADRAVCPRRCWCRSWSSTRCVSRPYSPA